MSWAVFNIQNSINIALIYMVSDIWQVRFVKYQKMTFLVVLAPNLPPHICN